MPQLLSADGAAAAAVDAAVASAAAPTDETEFKTLENQGKDCW